MPDMPVNRLKKINENPEQNPEWADQEATLENPTVAPFSDHTDWYGENGEAVITVLTMQKQLYNNWEKKARETSTHALATVDGEPQPNDKYTVLYNHRNYDADHRGPGVYRDSQQVHEEGKVDESYTIIVPENFMTEEILENYINLLNEEFDRNFKLPDIDTNQREAEWIKGAIDADLEDIDDDKIDEIIKEVLKHK